MLYSFIKQSMNPEGFSNVVSMCLAYEMLLKDHYSCIIPKPMNTAWMLKRALVGSVQLRNKESCWVEFKLASRSWWELICSSWLGFLPLGSTKSVILVLSGKKIGKKKFFEKAHFSSLFMSSQPMKVETSHLALRVPFKHHVSKFHLIQWSLLHNKNCLFSIHIKLITF